MEREKMIDAIVGYAEQHGMGPNGLLQFVGDVTGTYLEIAAGESYGDTFSRLCPSELESVYEVVLAHNSREPQSVAS